MTTIISADWHLSANPRDSYRSDAIARLIKIVDQYDATRFILLGDICEQKDRHPAELVNTVTDLIKGFSNSCPVYILLGNHDYVSEDCPFFMFLRHINGVQWVNHPYSNSLDGLGKCLFLPHTRNHVEEWSGIPMGDHDWIFAHNTFEGTKGEGGHLLRGIPLNVFPTDCKVISGDVHTPQKVGCVTYVGSPYTVDFGDSFNPRVLMIDDDGKRYSISMHGPQKRLVEVSSVEDLEEITNVIEGDIVKVRLTLKPKDRDKWPVMREAVREWGKRRRYVIYAVQPMLVEGAVKRERREVEVKDDKQILGAFAEARQLDVGTTKAGLRLLGDSDG